MLQGYSFPLTADGSASLLTAPPWRFAGSVLMVDFTADPDVLARHVPNPMRVDPEGRCAAVFAQWQWCSADSREQRDPASSQFSEFLVLVSCYLGDRAVARAPFAWVDDTLAMTRGWVQGMPKQMGRIGMTHSFDVGDVTPRSRGTGTHFARARDSEFLLCEAAVDISHSDVECGGAPPPLHTVPLVHTRHEPPWTGDERPDRLVLSEVRDVAFSPVVTGPARLSLGDTPILADFAPLGVGAGHLFDYSETLVGGRLVDEGPRLHDPRPIDGGISK
ncbi:acetoacetate decarboxylase family protein [Rhodococcus fascians]|uniref:acetoacetate decarboxylase family protein n=1 Tax=Rhodococcoides fascians TaxID=1828 RepID=UPI0035304138|nr:acetoacetate decarboxylase family protein [Rhodococcus fascians]